ncbi:glycerophosphodiester phosphodiesterase [Patescibacteria group bacterium]|nr:glycerophosphodiester phosphodiesterase [Patescibacteria group bacterium]
MEVYAHRGSHSGYHHTNFENTMEAFQYALEEQKCDGIECDLRMSQDGVPLIHHDPITRETNQVIRDTRFNDLQTPYKIPRLEEVFLLLKKTNKQCFLELKESDPMLLIKLIRLMDEMQMREQITCIGFPEHARALLHLAERCTIRVGLIPRTPIDVMRAIIQPFHIIMLGWTSPKERNLFLRFSFLLPFVVRLIRRRNKEIVAGVINNRIDMQEFLDYGISRIITDNVPEALFLKNSLM